MIAATGAEVAGIALTRYREEQLHALVLSEMQHRSRKMFAMIGGLVGHNPPRSSRSLGRRRIQFNKAQACPCLRRLRGTPHQIGALPAFGADCSRSLLARRVQCEKIQSMITAWWHSETAA